MPEKATRSNTERIGTLYHRVNSQTLQVAKAVARQRPSRKCGDQEPQGGLATAQSRGTLTRSPWPRMVPWSTSLVPECAKRRTSRLHQDRKSTRLNSSHLGISYAVFCL